VLILSTEVLTEGLPLLFGAPFSIVILLLLAHCTHVAILLI